jgi:acyl dehydratase
MSEDDIEMPTLPSSEAGTATPAAGPLLDAVDSWTDASKHVLNSYLEANRAIMAGLGLRNATGERVDAPIAELSYATLGWSFERSVDTRAELGVGDFVRFSKPVLDDDVHAFAQASGDTNRLHLDDGFAAETRFDGRIAHGTLVSGLISAALARLPGLTVYLSQDVEYRGPVEIGGVVTAECEIVEDLGDEQYRLTTRVHTEEGETVIDGEAVVLIDELPDG